MIKDGSKPSIVFARVKGEDKWYELGNIASKGDLIAASCLVPCHVKLSTLSHTRRG